MGTTSQASDKESHVVHADDYKRMYDRSAIGVFRSAPNGRYLMANPAGVRLHGYGSEVELLRAVRNVSNEVYVHLEDRKTLLRLLEERGSVEGFECEIYRHRTKERIWVRQNIFRVTDEDGSLLYLEGYVEDITERKWAETLLARAMDATPAVFALFDPDDRLVICNRRYRELYETAAAPILPGVAFETLVRAFAAATGVGGSVEETETWVTKRLARRTAPAQAYNYQRKDGEWIEVTDHVLEDGSILTTGLVITERRNTMEELVASERSRKEAQRIASLGSWELTAEDELSWSDEVFDIFDVDQEEFDGTKNMFYQRVHPDDRELVKRASAEALETRQPYDFVHRIVRPDGQIRIVRERAEVACDPAGIPIKLMGTVQDITKLKDVEEQLRQAQKMEAIGQLTGGVAHDFNNLLAIIQGNAEFISRQLGHEDPRVQAVLRAARRGANLVQQLLAFSRQQPLKSRVLDLNMLVQDIRETLSRSLGETIEIRTALDKGLWYALADPVQVETALLNLAINARDAMPDGGTLVIETGNTRLDQADTKSHPEVVPGDYVVLAVTDSGTGMASHVVEHAFEPFFTTKEVGQGTGLGLSMVYGFAKQSGGHAVIRSKQGHGTTVKLYLPRTEGQVETIGPEETEAPSGRGETVLVVEDDAEVRQFAERLLEDLDYRVFTTKDGRTALGVLEHIPQPDLLLSDVVLPSGLSGPDLAKRVLELYPGLKIIFMSGYPANAAKGKGLVDSGDVLLSKPFSRLQLARALRKALD